MSGVGESGEAGKYPKLPVAYRFEDLEVWKKARVLTRRIYEISGRLPYSKDFGLSTQTQRAAVSIMANIAEGFARRSSGEFVQFLNYATGSCAEVRSHLYIAEDLCCISNDEGKELQAACEEIDRLLTHFSKSIQSKALGRRPKST